jgi:hypothetical protein
MHVGRPTPTLVIICHGLHPAEVFRVVHDQVIPIKAAIHVVMSRLLLA